MSTAPRRDRDDRILADARMDDEVANALSVYEAERIARRRSADVGPFELPDRITPLEIDAAIGNLVDLLERVDEPLAAMAVLYVAAYRAEAPRRMRDAVLALGTCGPAAVGFAAAARTAAVDPIFGRPTRAAAWAPRPAVADADADSGSDETGEWSPDDRVGPPLEPGELVIDRRGGDGSALEVRALRARDGGAVRAYVARPGSDVGRWAPVEDLARLPKPVIEPLNPRTAEGADL